MAICPVVGARISACQVSEAINVPAAQFMSSALKIPMLKLVLFEMLLPQFPIKVVLPAAPLTVNTIFRGTAGLEGRL